MQVDGMLMYAERIMPTMLQDRRSVGNYLNKQNLIPAKRGERHVDWE